MEEEESHFYRRQVGRKNGVKVSGKLYQERKSGGKESENLSVKSLPRLTHAHIHVNTSSCTHTPLQTRRHTHTRTHTHFFSMRLQPVVFVLLYWLLYRVHLNADWSASLSFRQRHKRRHTQWGLFSAEWGCLGVGKHLQNRHSTSTLKAQWGAKPWWIMRDYS